MVPEKPQVTWTLWGSRPESATAEYQLIEKPGGLVWKFCEDHGKPCKNIAKPLNPLVVLHFLSVNIDILWGGA